MDMLKRHVIVAWAAMAATAAGAGTAPPPLDPATCKPSGSLMRLAGLTEASGLVASRTTPGRLWSHNDSGKPEIVAIDSKGNVTGRVSIAGATVDDWEAISTAPCSGGWCLYLADIGDNSANRPGITIYRVPEPSQAGGSVEVNAVVRASYPDGAHDAEALLALPDGTLYIVTKGDTGQVALYRVPRNSDGSAVRLERVGAPLSKAPPAADARITDGAASPDGEWVVLRTRAALVFYRAADFVKGNFSEARRIDLKPVGEPQGEAVAFGPANTVYLAGEGGGKAMPGTLAVLSCAG
jgi:hypothetical protein